MLAQLTNRQTISSHPTSVVTIPMRYVCQASHPFLSYTTKQSMKSTSYLIYFLYYREVSLAANNADGGDTAGDTAGASDLQLKLF